MDLSRSNADGGDGWNEHAVVTEMDVKERVKSALALEDVEGRAVVMPRCVAVWHGRQLGCVDVVSYSKLKKMGVSLSEGKKRTECAPEHAVRNVDLVIRRRLLQRRWVGWRWGNACSTMLGVA